MANDNQQDRIEDEVLIIEDGGEMPEVTYNGSVYYLTKDNEGPELQLTDGELRRLKLAVVEGYRRIIIRDLTPENRSKGLYRGLARCAVNWDRLLVFCDREGIEMGTIAGEVCDSLRHFFERECEDVISLGSASSVNCSVETLSDFFAKVGLDHSLLPEGWQGVACG